MDLSDTHASLPKPFLAWLPAVSLVLATLGVTGALALAPPDGGPVAAIFPPGTSTTEAYRRIATAGGTIMDAVPFGSILISRSSSPGYASRLREHGALIVFGVKASANCTSP